MTTITKTSTCRLCTAMCPIVVTIEDGRAVEVHGDREAPLFEGYTCPKGRALPEMHANPKRLLHSLRRRPDGSHEQIASEDVVDEIADRLRDVVDRHGPNAVAIYIGTSSSAYPAMGSIAAALLTALGSKMIFSAASIDQPGTRIADAIHGLWLGGRTPFDEVDAFLFAGTNPVISKQFLAENPAKRLARAVERGTKIVVIDPRRTETARWAHVHLQARPGQDAVVMAGILHLILREGLVDQDFIRRARRLASSRSGLRSRPFTPEFVARQADIPIDDLVEAARTLGTARRGGAGGGTGISMTSCTSVVSYLLLCLMSVRGWWAREGDRIERPNVLMPPNHAKAQARRPYRALGFGHKMRVRGLEQTNGGLPTAALADEILLPGEGQIRALLNVGGSPMMAWPDQRRTQRGARVARAVRHDRRRVLPDGPNGRLRGRDQDDVRDAEHDAGHRGHQVLPSRLRLPRAVRPVHAGARRPTRRLRPHRGLAVVLPPGAAPRALAQRGQRLRSRWEPISRHRSR